MKRGPKPQATTTHEAADFELLYWIERARRPDWIPTNAARGDRDSVRKLAGWGALRLCEIWQATGGRIPADTERGAFALALANILDRIAAGESPDEAFGWTYPSDCEPAPAARIVHALWLERVALQVQLAAEAFRSPGSPKDRARSAAHAIGLREPHKVLVDELAQELEALGPRVPAKDARLLAARLVSRSPALTRADGKTQKPSERLALEAHRAFFVKERNSRK
jgi:hypothetical protein